MIKEYLAKGGQFVLYDETKRQFLVGKKDNKNVKVIIAVGENVFTDLMPRLCTMFRRNNFIFYDIINEKIARSIEGNLFQDEIQGRRIL